MFDGIAVREDAAYSIHRGEEQVGIAIGGLSQPAANTPVPQARRLRSSCPDVFVRALESARDSERIRRNFYLPRKISTATLARVVPSVSAIWS